MAVIILILAFVLSLVFELPYLLNKKQTNNSSQKEANKEPVASYFTTKKE